MSQGNRIKVHITGGPPWGFRLQGGGNTPVAIAKIRRKSKAYNARLQEGDEIVSVNGRNCQNLSRDVTMSYVDGAKESLDMEVIRRDKNFNTVNTSAYSISNNNPTITTGKPATIQLVPSGTFQAPGRPASVRQTTNVQTRTIPVERGQQTQQTITRTVTQRVGDGDEKTSTTREVKTFGSGPGQETTTAVINTGGQPQTKPVAFQPAKTVGNAKPSGWTPSQQVQQRQPQMVKAGQRTTIHLQGSFDDEPPVQQQQQQPVDLAQLIPSQSTTKPSNVQFTMRPSLAKPQSVSPTRHPPEAFKPSLAKPQSVSPVWHPPEPSKPSLAKPQSVSPIWHPPEPSRPAPQQETKRWSAPVQSNVGKEMTITFGGPGQPMKIPIGVAAPMAAEPPQQETTVTKYSTRTVTTLQETSVDEESSDEEPPQEVVRRTTTTMFETRTPKPAEPMNILEDPSIILRGGFKPKDTKKLKMMRPKSYPGAVVDEVDLDETDKMKVCKTIADLLMFPKNKQAKGARMFAKRRKRSAKYTIEAYGVRGEDEELPEQIGPKIPPKPPIPPPGSEGVIRMPAAPPPPAPPPPPPPTTEPIFIPKLGISIMPTDFTITKKKDKCEHKTVSPKQCGMLVADLKGASGRGASMFERRRKRSDKFVLTNEGKLPDASPEGKENEPPKTVTLEFIARHGQEEHEEPAVKPAVHGTPPVNLQRKSPWEAAMDSPVGAIDSAFNHMAKKKGFTGTDSPPKADRPKPPAEWMKTSNMLPQVPAKPPAEPKIKPKFRAAGPPTPGENGHSPSPPLFKPKFDARKQAAANYKDFNVKARGWGGGGSPHQSPGDTPPSASPGSVHSAEMGRGSPGIAASFPTQPLKYSGGYNDFNTKPRSFAPGGGGGGFSPGQRFSPSPKQEAMESGDL